MDIMKDLEKYDLHCHLDGSLSAVTVRKLADVIGKELPRMEKLRKMLQVQPDCTSLKEYLEKFDLPLSCLVTRENFRIAVRELLADAASENVVYMEIRFAPLLSVHEKLPVREIIEGALDGLKDGQEMYHIRGGLILCGMRHMHPDVNVELVRTAAEYMGAGICAVDLAGDEAAFSVTKHAEMFETARKLGIPYTIHAGECGSVSSMWNALGMGTGRIGHGVAAQKDRKLVEYCAKHNICFEMCPTSNLQTHAVASMDEYPLLDFMEAGIPVTVNTDNRAVSDTTVSRELELLQKYYKLTSGDLKILMEHAKNAAFIK